ncbi:MAG: serine/threonine-protein kinase [Planctomycetota bacterium]
MFQLAADLAPNLRPALLAERCADDPSTRRDVELLLRRYDTPTVPSLVAPDRRDEIDVAADGDAVGPYKIVHLIGEGGFGSIYLAEQQYPVRREVALKIIKLGMDTKQVIARFEAERQALAMMDHPNIARAFDAGATESGRPYFVMEFVQGTPITEYCDEHAASPRERLKLFVQVCRAVQHAHQKGVIHRDIKPSNVLVSFHDGLPIPKIIDFGIAKATRERLTERTLSTGIHQFIGTPEYVSPEQVNTAPDAPADVDTRSDIYSLGVLLYELLTGTTPFDSTSVRTADFADIRLLICEHDPAAPSRRLSSLGKELRDVAKLRRTEPRLLSKLMRGDLDWIVMKALEKDRSRRYDTAEVFAADIERHLNNEPVTAGPPGAMYQLRKMAARHKVAFGFVGAMFTIVSGFGLWMGIMYANASILQREANSERATAEANLARARAAEERAKMDARTSQQVASFLTELFELADPLKTKRDTVTARAILDRSAERIRLQISDDSETQAALLDAMGQVYSNLGLCKRSAALLKEALEIRRERLGSEHADTLSTMNRLGHSLLIDGQSTEAGPLLREALEISRRVLGNDHPETISAIQSLALVLQSEYRLWEAEPLFRESLETSRRIKGGDHPDTLEAAQSLGWLLEWQRNAEEAEALSREAYETSVRVLGDKHVVTANSMTNLGLILLRHYNFSEAEPLLRRGLEIRRQIYGDDHAEVLSAMQNLARLWLLQGKTADAEVQHRKALAGYRRVFGEEHQNTLCGMMALAESLLEQNKVTEAESLLRPALAGLRSDPGEDHRYTVRCVALLGRTLERKGELAEARKLYRQAFERFQCAVGVEHVETIASLKNWCDIALQQGELGECQTSLRTTLQSLQRSYSPSCPRFLGLVAVHARVVHQQGKPAEAETILRKAVTAARHDTDEDTPEIVILTSLLGGCLTAQGHYKEAETLLLKSHSTLQGKLGEADNATREAGQRIVNLYTSWGRLDQATRWQEELADSREGEPPPQPAKQTQ